MPLADRTLAELLAEIAAATPAPGGGSTAAVACALAAALVEMSAGPPHERAAALRARALELADEDLSSFGPVLDAQSVRLQNAQDRLTGVHPDYWFYVTELRGIRDRARDVVARVRAASAR